jgi:hypothetical protein
MIQYQYCDGNSPADEKNDCTVRALKIATGCKYYDAHRLLHNAGRKPRRGFIIEKLLRSHGFFFGCAFSKLKFRKPITLSKFVKKHHAGTFYLRTQSHAFVIKDAVVLDMFKPRTYSRIVMAWKVEPLMQ